MPGSKPNEPFTFPRWSNLLLPFIVLFVLGGAGYVVALATYAGSPQTLAVGYSPRQPIPYSHAVHAGQLKMDCRYCHNTVETAPFAALPSTQTCLNCHNDTTKLRWNGQPLTALRTSAKTGEPIPWVKVHDLPDYVFFDHGSHVQKGVGCVECHGRVDQMTQVTQVKPLSMGWCLDCHTAPKSRIRPRDRVTDLAWKPTQATESEWNEMRELRRGLASPRQLTDCTTCHR